MAPPRRIVVLGDLTHPFEKDLKKLLNFKDNADLRDFFNRTLTVLRREIGTLPQHEQVWFPRFTTLQDFGEGFSDLIGAPVSRFTLLCLYQIGVFIQHFDDARTPYPNFADTRLLGLCTGSFAAAAISESRTTRQLAIAGTDAVLFAFHTSLLSLRTRNDLVGSVVEASQPWSAVFGLSLRESSLRLQRYNRSKSLHVRSQLYISAISPQNVTISGPPAILDDFTTAESLSSYKISIQSPYHAQHLFTPVEMEQHHRSSAHKSQSPKRNPIPIISPSTEKMVDGNSFAENLENAVRDTLCAQIRWDRISKTLRDQFGGTEEGADVQIVPIASNAGSLLASILRSITSATITVQDNLTSTSAQPPLINGTGRFDDSKIAIVGFSGRYPEAADNAAFWKLLMEGRDTHRTIPEDRFDWKSHYDPTGAKKNTSKVKHGCFINEPGLFDARFFNVSPKEAEDSDPAQRLALMATYEALEMSGFVSDRTPSTQRDRVGVFFGVTSDDWREVNSGQDIGTYFIPGGNRAFVPGRISYFFRFSGPSVSVDTACSSSFSAINVACNNLWQGVCDTAIAGGTNVLTNPDNFAGLDRGHFLSTTGNCNPFDNDASGYCRADAVGSVILKRMDDAIADNDPIFGVIASVHTNHCGQTVSITRPHEGDQLSLFKRMMRHSSVEPSEVNYVEMHGTGTQAGDAAEMKSVLSAFEVGLGRTAKQPLYLGAVKANVGHSESASGVTALIKVLLMFQNDTIPPHVGIKGQINQGYPSDLTERHVKICSTPTTWRRKDCMTGRRTCFLNNFSAAGGNTAVLLEDGPQVLQKPALTNGRSVHPVIVTAKSIKSLKDNLIALLAYVAENRDVSLESLSYTTTARRAHHKFRIVSNGTDITNVRTSLRLQLETINDLSAIPSVKHVPKTVFVFTGQGTLYQSMGKQLFDCVDTFRADILRFDTIAMQQGFPSIRVLVIGGLDETAMNDVDTVVSQLALICIQMALHRLWISWGIKPSAVIGHSLGEYAALYAAGVLTANDAIYLGGARAQLMKQHCTKFSHSMVAIKASVSTVQDQMSGTVCSVACANSPMNTVVSGPAKDVDDLSIRLRAQGLECVGLAVPYAFHSAQMDSILPSFEEITRSVPFAAPKIPFISPLLGRLASESGELDSSYLPLACRATVNFCAAIEAARDSGFISASTQWLEIGSHPACSNFIKKTLGTQTITLNTLRQGTDPWHIITNSLQTLYLGGCDVQWNEYQRSSLTRQQVLPLPSYRWDLKKYWIMYKHDFCLTKGDAPIDLPLAKVVTEPTPPAVPLSTSVHQIIEEQHEKNESALLIESDIHDARLMPLMEGHIVNGAKLCTSSLYADIAITMAKHLVLNSGTGKDDTGLDCSSMTVERPLIARSDATSQLLRVQANADWTTGSIRFSFFSVSTTGRKVADHACCVVKVSSSKTWLQEWQSNAYLIKGRIEGLKKDVERGNAHKLKRGLVYRLFSSLVDYQDRFQGMQEVVLDSEMLEATARVVFQVPDEGYELNPCWLDSCGSIAGFIMNGNDTMNHKSQVFINHGWRSMRFAKKLEYGKTYQTYNRMQLQHGTTYAGDTYVLEDDVIVAVFEGIEFQGVPRSVLDGLLPNKIVKLSPSAPLKVEELLASRPNKPRESSKRLAHPVLEPPPKATDLGSRLKSIISEEAGVDASELKSDLQFSEVGIDSLLSLTISSRLQEEGAMNISSTTFLKYPTLGEMIAHLSEAATESTGTTVTTPMSSSDSSDDGESTAATSVADGEDEQSSNIIDAIQSTIAEEAGVPLEEITPLTALSELGVDSLLTLTITSRLQELGFELPPNILSQYETLFEIQCALVEQGFIAPPPVKGRVERQDSAVVLESSVPPATSSNTFCASDAPHATSIRLSGSPITSKTTVFLFPDGAGSSTSYATLSPFPNTIVFGLNCPWLRNPSEMTCSLAQYVSKFLLEVRKRQPSGPYIFGGWSAGGILAYEAAQQLVQEGQVVSHLLLLDSPDPVGLENPPQRLYDFLEKIDMFGATGKKAPEWLRPHFTAFLKMLDGYEVKRFVGTDKVVVPKTHIFYAKDGLCKPGMERPEMRDDDPREMKWLVNERTEFGGGGWRSLIGEERLNTSVVEGVNHYTMLSDVKGLKILADGMERVLG